LNGDKIAEVIFGSDDGGIYVVDYPYLFSLSYTQGARESSRSIHDSLMKMGGDAIELAEKLGDNAAIKTGEAGFWEIVRVVGSKDEKFGSITFKEALGKLEIQVVAQRKQFDARRTGTIVRAYNYPNRQRYHYQTLGPVASSPSIADLNNDNHLEFTVASDDGTVYAFGSRRQFIRSDANEYLALAEKMYSLGRRSKASEYVSKAIELHGEANDSAGLSQDNALVKRLEADDILLKAHELYNESLVLNASDYLTQAALIYASINYTKYGWDVEKLSDLLEAELYYREAFALYSMGDLDNAAEYALKASELFFFHNESEGLKRSSILYEIAKEHSDADAHYVAAMNMFFVGGYSENVTEELSKAIGIYKDINASRSIAMAEDLTYRINATKLTDDAYALYGRGDIMRAYSLASEASVMFKSINYTPGLYRAESLLNNSAGYVNAEDLFENAKKFYSKGDVASAIDYAQKAERAYSAYNASDRLSEVGSFINKSRVEYKTRVQRPRYLMILFNVMVGVFSGIMLVLSAEKLMRDRRKAREQKKLDEQNKF
jgi:tetratricopeptide (TPR) repeat protein